jgi:hypothetical protein
VHHARIIIVFMARRPRKKKKDTGLTAPIAPFRSRRWIEGYVQRYQQPGDPDPKIQAAKIKAVHGFIARESGGRAVIPEPIDIVDSDRRRAARRELTLQWSNAPGARACIFPMTTASAMLRGVDPKVQKAWSNDRIFPMPMYTNYQRLRTHVITTRGLSAAFVAGRVGRAVTGVWSSKYVEAKDVEDSIRHNASVNGGVLSRSRYVNQPGLDGIKLDPNTPDPCTILDCHIKTTQELDKLCKVLTEERKEEVKKKKEVVACFTLSAPHFVLGDDAARARVKKPNPDLTFHEAFKRCAAKYGIAFNAVLTTTRVVGKRVWYMWCIVALPRGTHERARNMADGYLTWRSMKSNSRAGKHWLHRRQVAMYYPTKDGKVKVENVSG